MNETKNKYEECLIKAPYPLVMLFCNDPWTRFVAHQCLREERLIYDVAKDANVKSEVVAETLAKILAKDF